MKMRIHALAALAFLVCTANASAGDWYNNVGSQLARIEQAVDGSIWVSVPVSVGGGTISVIGAAGGTCHINVVHLLPPPNREKDWLAMLLTATAAGKPINVYGDCVQGSYLINATRLVIDYQ